jgi:hypothetical protein
VLYEESAVDPFVLLNRPAVNAAGDVLFGRLDFLGSYDLMLTNGVTTTPVAFGLDTGSRWGINDHGQFAYSVRSGVFLRDGALVDSASSSLPFTPYGEVYVNNRGVVAFGKQTEKPGGTSWGVFIAQNGITTPIVETDPGSARIVHLQDLGAQGHVLISDTTPGNSPSTVLYRADASGAPFINLSPGVDPLMQKAAMNDNGIAAFFLESPQFGLYAGDGSAPPQLVSSKPEFDDHLFAGVAINDEGLIAQFLAKRFGSAAPSFAIFLGDQPLVQEGDILLGRPVIGTTGIFQGSLNEAGQLAFALNLGDDPATPENDPLRVIVLASSVPEPQTWAALLAGFVILGAAARRRRTSEVCAREPCVFF